MTSIWTRRTIASAVAGTSVIAGLALGGLMSGAFEGLATGTGDGVVTRSQGTREETLRQASKAAGFDLTVPWLPTGFEIRGVLSPEKGVIRGDFKTASLEVRGPSSGFMVYQNNQPTEVDPTKSAPVHGPTGLKILRTETELGLFYTLNAKGRSFELHLHKEFLIPEANAIRILESMVPK